MTAAEAGMDRKDLAIDARDLCRTYPVGGQAVQALRGVTLTIPCGCFAALHGRSGSGKTTLLNCLGGLDRPDSGRALLFGEDIQALSEAELTRWRREKVGFIFQTFGLLPTLSAYENVELVLRIAGAGGKARRERTLACLDLVGIGRWRDHRPYELSGGQQQRVAIARALANSPRLLLADEATGELDSQTGREVLALLRRIVEQEQLTLLAATHDRQVDEFADRIYQLQDGSISGYTTLSGG